MSTIIQILGPGVATLCCDPDDEGGDVLATMREHGLQSMPVVRARGTLVGIVTREQLERACPLSETSQMDMSNVVALDTTIDRLPPMGLTGK